MKNLLIAEDDKVIRKVIEKTLADSEFNLFIAENGNRALEILEAEEIDIAILDWMLPGIEGIDLCKRIRDEKSREYTYIILLTSKKDHQNLLEGFSAGADDYVKKPFNSHELKARVHTGKRIVDLQEQLLKTQEKLRIQATRDGLTDLLNRRSVMKILERELERSRRTGAPLGLIMADLDHFKKINDTHGHQAGDLVLKDAAFILKKSLRKYDHVGRYGGEEFIIILPDCNDDKIKSIGERLKNNLSSSKTFFNKKEITATISMGLVVVGQGAISSHEEMIQAADKALYTAKMNGRNRWVMGDPGESSVPGKRIDLDPDHTSDLLN